MRAHTETLEFRIGDRVEFQPEGRLLVMGMLTRYNKKKVTVIADAGEHWNVAPRFLRRAMRIVVSVSRNVADAKGRTYG